MVYRSVAHSLNTSTTSVPAATASLEMSVPRAGPTDGATAKWPHHSPPGTPLWQMLALQESVRPAHVVFACCRHGGGDDCFRFAQRNTPTTLQSFSLNVEMSV